MQIALIPSPHGAAMWRQLNASRAPSLAPTADKCMEAKTLSARRPTMALGRRNFHRRFRLRRSHDVDEDCPCDYARQPMIQSPKIQAIVSRFIAELSEALTEESTSAIRAALGGTPGSSSGVRKRGPGRPRGNSGVS